MARGRKRARNRIFEKEGMRTASTVVDRHGTGGSENVYMWTNINRVRLHVRVRLHGRKIERDEAPKRQKVLAPPLQPYWLIEISQ